MPSNTQYTVYEKEYRYHADGISWPFKKLMKGRTIQTNVCVPKVTST